MGNNRKLKNTQELIERKVFNTIEWQENITVLNLSNREISSFDENVHLPQNLVVLNLSNNKLTEVPRTVMKLDNLKTLDLSCNNVVLFDETPNFCHTLETLNLFNNKLEGPPYWVWAEKPKNLVSLNLSNNNSLCHSFVNYYFEEMLQYTTLVNIIYLHNCKLDKHMKFMSTLRHAKIVKLGDTDYNCTSVNHIENVPCVGLEDCCDIEVLNLCNTHIYTVQHNIDIYHNLIEINLSQNNISCLPNEFCNLKNLRTCILSYNKILYLPDEMHKLVKLTELYLDNNELCMIPEALCQTESLKILDLYNNHLYEGVENIKHFEQYDFAQNYSDEPNSGEYLEKKERLREQFDGRLDGRAPEVIQEQSEESEREFEDEETQSEPQEPPVFDSRCSSPEDWDSDDYWIPALTDFTNQSSQPYYRHAIPTPSRPTSMQWLEFVKRKMAEGNFCPMDMHLSISITEKVRYEKMNNPQPLYESDGQFDDYSDDCS